MTLAAPRLLAPVRAVALAPRLVVALAFGLSATWHAVASFWHRTPAIYTDELLYTKLAQSVAAGDWLSLRGEPLFFPGVLPVLLQSPAWLIEDAETAYLVIKVVNALVMASGAVGAYWLARALVEPRHAAVAAVLAAASPALVYHGYLMSEALAYPVFLFATGVVVRALARATPAWHAGAVGAIGIACATRIQFAALGAAFLMAVPLAGGIRRHAPAVVTLALGAAVGLTALGPYAGAASLEYEPAQVLRWAGWTAALLPFGVAWLLVPGALLGVACSLARPRRIGERAFAALVVALLPLTLLQCGLVGAGQAFRPLERYSIYLAPLLAVAFLVWVDRGAPSRRTHAWLAVMLTPLPWLLPLPELAPIVDGSAFSFDSMSLSAYAAVVAVLGHADAATIFAGGASLACVGVGLAGRRLLFPAGPVAVAATAILVAMGVAAYAGDRGMSAAAAAAWSGPEPDWLEETTASQVDYLALPGASPHYAYALETWNRNFGRAYVLGAQRTDFLRDGWLAFASDGRPLLNARPARAGTYVVNEYGTNVQFTTATRSGPRDELRVIDVDASTRVVGLAQGLFFDGWTASELRYRVWGPPGGRYRVRMELRPGTHARTAVLESGFARRSVHVRAGEAPTVELAEDGPLRLTVDRTEFGGDPRKPRHIGVRITALAYLGPSGSVAAQALPRCCR